MYICCRRLSSGKIFGVENISCVEFLSVRLITEKFLMPKISRTTLRSLFTLFLFFIVCLFQFCFPLCISLSSLVFHSTSLRSSISLPNSTSFSSPAFVFSLTLLYAAVHNFLFSGWKVELESKQGTPMYVYMDVVFHLNSLPVSLSFFLYLYISVFLFLSLPISAYICISTFLALQLCWLVYWANIFVMGPLLLVR